MSRPWTGCIAGAAFALYAAAGAAAYAQPAPSPAEAQDPGRPGHHVRTVIVGEGEADGHTMVIRSGHDGEGSRHHMMMRHDMMRPGGDPAEHLRTMLQLKPGQEAALTAFLAATLPRRDQGQRMEMAEHDGAATTPQRLAEMEKHMAEHTAAMHIRIEATRRFYDQLEPSQKKVFDALPMPMMGPMMGPPMKVRMDMPPVHAMLPMPPKAPPPRS
ncbi:Spy/CpxP family protein refolding chaperone [Phenylobacterium sp.]|uniref:Spy/CpxP family protein refolding chaperone n=1 Tax=Phenylobacterium sp. TaxID=1871053 RepID=UPI00286AD03F|nr:Spy/CpxP family protein refolding chaperone [Phenylobacterium sp.]